MPLPTQIATQKHQPAATAQLSNQRPKADRHRADRADTDKVCWITVKQYPYQPDHQVELLHLQAEADALIVKLQAAGQKQLAERTMV